jgi:hypothetical protein
MAASAPSRTPPFVLPSHLSTKRHIPTLALPARSLTARLRLLLSDRARFTQSLARESEALLAAATPLLSSPASLCNPSAAPRLADSLTGAWRLEAQITADLCDAPITPFDGEDIRALASSATAILEALDDLHAAAVLAVPAALELPLVPLCAAALESVESVAALLADPLALAKDPARLPLLASRETALRSSCRAAESALFARGAGTGPAFVLGWNLLAAFGRLRFRVRMAVCQAQRAVLKNS